MKIKLFENFNTNISLEEFKKITKDILLDLDEYDFDWSLETDFKVLKYISNVKDMEYVTFFHKSQMSLGSYMIPKGSKILGLLVVKFFEKDQYEYSNADEILNRLFDVYRSEGLLIYNWIENYKPSIKVENGIGDSKWKVDLETTKDPQTYGVIPCLSKRYIICYDS